MAIDRELYVPLAVLPLTGSIPPLSVIPPRPRCLNHTRPFLCESNPDRNFVRTDFNSGWDRWPEPAECQAWRWLTVGVFSGRWHNLKVVWPMRIEQGWKPNPMSALQISFSDNGTETGH
jgi:hypothetical protein